MKNNLKEAHQFIQSILNNDSSRKGFSSYEALLLAAMGKYGLSMKVLTSYLNEIAATNALFRICDSKTNR